MRKVKVRLATFLTRVKATESTTEHVSWKSMRLKYEPASEPLHR